MKKIVVPTDFSEVGRHAYVAAASFATSYDGSIQLVHETESLPNLYFESVGAPHELNRYHDQLRDRLDAELHNPAFQDVRVNCQLIHRESEVGSVAEYAKSEGADLIVQATHGRSGLAHSLLGSFAERVARRASVPVLTFRPRARHEINFQPKSILVPFDLSENSKSVFPIVRAIAERFDSKVRLLHVFPEVSVRGDWGDAQERLRVSAETVSRVEEELKQLGDSELQGLDVTIESRFGDAYQEVIKESEHLPADLIIMATHGRTGLSHLYFGSIAEKVLRTCPCSVLTRRPVTIRQESPR